ncbi:MAG: cell division protein SepF, partial [Microcoleaceae cyanobacterium]
MNNLFARVKEWVGLNEPVEYEYEYDEEVDGQQYRNVYQQQPAVSSLTTGEASGRTARPNRLRERAMATTN